MYKSFSFSFNEASNKSISSCKSTSFFVEILLMIQFCSLYHIVVFKVKHPNSPLDAFLRFGLMFLSCLYDERLYQVVHVLIKTQPFENLQVIFH